MKLQVLKAKVIEAASAALLETAINAFLSADTEDEYVEMQYHVWDATHYSVVILYTQ